MSETMKPDTITVPEAVSRLVEWAVELFTFRYGLHYDPGLFTWNIRDFCSTEYDGTPDWIRAIINGKGTPAAVRVGLEDLFVTILEGDEK